MNLDEILDRIESLLSTMDAEIEVPPRAGRTDVSSVGSAEENQFVSCLMQTWARDYPEELPDAVLERHSRDETNGWLQRTYVEDPDDWRRTSRADIAINTHTSQYPEDEFEWLIEVKRINLVPEHGGKEQHLESNVAKLFSPFVATGGVIHDIGRICTHPDGRKKAVVIYAFSFDETVLRHCQNHPLNCQQIKAGEVVNRSERLEELLELNDNEPIGISPFIEMVDRFYRDAGYNLGDMVHKPFQGLTRHPHYIQGDIVGWEVLCPSEEE